MKNHHHNGPIQPNSRTLLHEAIATRAYEKWAECGKPENVADAIWLEAEQELVTGRRKPESNLVLPISF